MWIIETATKFYGPFKTERAAAKWARKQLPLAKWSISLIHKP
jgi:hypothetical protein